MKRIAIIVGLAGLLASVIANVCLLSILFEHLGHDRQVQQCHITPRGQR